MEPSTALRWILAALALAAGAYHLGHAAYARGPHRPGFDVDLLHAAMGAAMAVMFVGGLDRSATPYLAGGFAAGTLWFVVRATGTYIDAGAVAAGDRTRQALCGVVMTGMLAVTLLARASPPGSATAGVNRMAGMAGMTAPGPSGISIDPQPLLYALLVIQALVVVWTAGRVRPPAAVSYPAHRFSQLATGVSGVCMLAMML